MISKVKFSLNSVVGLANLKTLWTRGNIGEQPVVVLIDPRATHNFLSQKLVEMLGILILAIQLAMESCSLGKEARWQLAFLC